MIRKYGLSLSAVALAIIGVVLSSVTSSPVKAEPRLADFYWRLDNASAPLQASSYTSISAAAYGDIDCSGTARVCKLRSNDSPLPSTMTDNDNNSIPDVTGIITAAPTKN